MATVEYDVSDANLGPAVNFACWAGMGLMGIVVLSKTATKLFGAGGQRFTIKYLQADDYFLGVALITGLAQNGAVMTEVIWGGGGRHIQTLSAKDVDNYQKSEYASYVAYVVTVGMAKLATFFFAATLANTNAHRIGVWSTVLLTVLWTLISALALAFQCPLPDVWRVFSTDTCVDQRAMWNAIEALNVFLEANAAALPVWFLWDLADISWRKKGSLVAAFALRLLAVPAFALRLYVLQASLLDRDATRAHFLFTILTQVALAICVATAALPFFRPLVDRIRPDWPSDQLRCLFGYNRSLYAASEASLSRGRLAALSTAEVPDGWWAMAGGRGGGRRTMEGGWEELGDGSGVPGGARSSGAATPTKRGELEGYESDGVTGEDGYRGAKGMGYTPGGGMQRPGLRGGLAGKSNRRAKQTDARHFSSHPPHPPHQRSVSPLPRATYAGTMRNLSPGSRQVVW